MYPHSGKLSVYKILNQLMFLKIQFYQHILQQWAAMLHYAIGPLSVSIAAPTVALFWVALSCRYHRCAVLLHISINSEIFLVLVCHYHRYARALLVEKKARKLLKCAVMQHSGHFFALC
jgi:hypothetical protein